MYFGYNEKLKLTNVVTKIWEVIGTKVSFDSVSQIVYIDLDNYVFVDIYGLHMQAYEIPSDEAMRNSLAIAKEKNQTCYAHVTYALGKCLGITELIREDETIL